MYSVFLWVTRAATLIALFSVLVHLRDVCYHQMIVEYPDYKPNLYTNDCRIPRLQTKLLKFADDYARLGLILKLMMMSLSIGLKFSL